MQHAPRPLPLHFLCNLIQPVLQIMAGVAILCCTDNDPRRMFEEVIHLFEWTASSFGEEYPEEDRVGEIADDEEVVVFVADVGHCDGGDLALDTVSFTR